MPTSPNEALARDIISAPKANGFRIAVIGLFCVNIDPEMIHRRGGLVFFVPSLIPFLLVLWLLRKGDVHTREPK